MLQGAALIVSSKCVVGIARRLRRTRQRWTLSRRMRGTWPRYCCQRVLLTFPWVHRLPSWCAQCTFPSVCAWGVTTYVHGGASQVDDKDTVNAFANYQAPGKKEAPPAPAPAKAAAPAPSPAPAPKPAVPAPAPATVAPKPVAAAPTPATPSPSPSGNAAALIFQAWGRNVLKSPLSQSCGALLACSSSPGASLWSVWCACTLQVVGFPEEVRGSVWGLWI
jgi:hypothetical protein